MSHIQLTIVRVAMEHGKFDPDAVDAQVYCINTSDLELTITVASESFITVDEETGETADQSSGKQKFVLAPAAVQLIAEIKGWEWDGHVGMQIVWKPTDGKTAHVTSYDFKSGSSDYYIETLKLHGRIIPSL